jgi:hypothetical protein
LLLAVSRLKKAIITMDGMNGGGAATPAAPAQTLSEPQNGEQQGNDGFKLKFCTVCASNQNRYAELLIALTELQC